MPASPLQNLAPSQAIDNGPNPDVAAAAGGPATQGMTTQQPASGQRESGLIDLHMAMDLMQTAITKLGAESSEGQLVMKALGSLTKVFGGERQQTDQLGNTQILQMLNSLPNAGGASPEQKAAQAQPAVPGMTGTPTPSAPPGAPPLMGGL